ncbi:MAG TPA: FtsX-like permease family protein [Myxococcales bacterium]
MTLAGLALRNAFLRNKTRSFLTVLGVIITAVAFLFLRTVLAAWYASSEASSADRVVTRNAISLTQTLPLNYSARIAQVPGVTKVTWSNWFGGIYKDRRNFFAQFAVDAETSLQVFTIHFLQGSKEGWLQDRNSAIVGKQLAEKYGWKVGDLVPLIGDVYPGDWQFKIAGIVEGSDDGSVANTMYFHWARLNETLQPPRKDQVGVFTTTIANPNDSPRISKAIDDLFANSDNETHTETEKAFRLQFVSGSGAILTALQAVSGVVLVIMALILGNTLAMGLRERTSELGTLRALGFAPSDVRKLALCEGALLGAVGGTLGALLAGPVVVGFVRGTGLPLPLSLRPFAALATVVVAAALGALAGALPARQAARMPIVDALRRQE